PRHLPRRWQQAAVAARALLGPGPLVIRGLKRRVRRVVYARGVRCPCCGWCGPQFRPFGFAARPNAQCPQCGAVERHRMLWLFLRDRGLLNGTRRLLHMAPEPALRALIEREPGLTYVTADLRSPIASLHADIARLPFAATAFDALI